MTRCATPWDRLQINPMDKPYCKRMGHISTTQFEIELQNMRAPYGWSRVLSFSYA